MKIYLVNDMKEALYQIKNDLGPEAMIINSRKVRRKGVLGFLGKRMLKVTAAVDDPVEKEEQQELSCAVGAGSVAQAPPGRGLREDAVARVEALNAYEKAAEKTGRSGENGVPDRKSTDTGSIPSTEVKLCQELSEVKVLLHRLMKDKEPSYGDKFLLKWRQLLLDLDVEESIVDHLLIEVKDKVDISRPDRDELMKMALRNEMTGLIAPVYRDLPAGNKVQVFIGPTGVGKTTTLAKLAAQYTLFHQKQIALITIDTYRIGAVEQLKTYGEIIGVRLDVVMTPDELEEAVERHRDKDLILIDTAGHPSHNHAQVRELINFLRVISLPQDIYLVISATTKNKDIFKSIEEFSSTGVSKIIFTKIDETVSPGSMLNVVYRTGIPISYVTDGQNVPDDIDQVYPKKLAKLLLKGVGNRNAGSGFQAS